MTGESAPPPPAGKVMSTEPSGVTSLPQGTGAELRAKTAAPELNKEVLPETTEPAAATSEPVPNDGRIDDKDKAWDMALSAKEDRYAAADSRRYIKNDQELVPMVEDYFANASSFSTPEERETARRALIAKIEPRLDRASEGGPLYRAYMDLAYGDKIGTFMHGTRADREKSSDDLQSRRAQFARERDDFADQVEELAGVIHDRPISDEYTRAHKGVDLTARGLIVLERTTNETLTKTDAAEKKIDETTVEYAFKYGLNDNSGRRPIAMNGQTVEWLASQLETTDKDGATELRYQYMQLTKSPEVTTLVEYTQFFRDAIKKVTVEPERKMALAAKTVVEDVRSGRASGKTPSPSTV